MSFFASRFIESQLLASDFWVELDLIQSKSPPTAESQGKEECCRSGVCCWRRPGELSQEDLTRLASHLHLTESEVFRQYLAVDQIHGEYILRFRRAGEEGGRMLNWRETYSLETPCVFLDIPNNNACKIHEVKPSPCVRHGCWKEVTSDEPQTPIWTEEALRELGWDGLDPDEYE